MRDRFIVASILLLSLGALPGPSGAPPEARRAETDRLVAAMLAETPALGDLRELTDTIGGRVTGTPENERAVEWALARFRAAGVSARAESFQMPMQWQERSIRASIGGDVAFEPGVVAKPFSAGTADAAGATAGEVRTLQAPLLDGGSGTAEDFARLGDRAKGAWILIETPVLDDVAGLAGLFAEYGASAGAEARTRAAGAAGLVCMSSRPKNLLYRIPALAEPNTLPALTMEREHAQRALRLLREGKALTLSVALDVDTGYAYGARNVIAEIPGAARPHEVVLMGAHLDSHDLGTGALDNGSNVALLIDLARQIVKLGLQPERTIRFALWNGEEQGLVGSWKYTDRHEATLDDHVVAASFDIGTGRISGFFTGGSPSLIPFVERYLEPVAGLGPFAHSPAALVGTDNFDFMIEGVPNLIAAQEDANYASNYHAESDTFDKVDARQLKLNSAIVAALVWGFANDEARLPRLDAAGVGKLIEDHGLETPMREFGIWPAWEAGERGRHE